MAKVLEQPLYEVAAHFLLKKCHTKRILKIFNSLIECHVRNDLQLKQEKKSNPQLCSPTESLNSNIHYLEERYLKLLKVQQQKEI